MKKSESEIEAQKVTKAFLLFLDARFSDARAGKSVYHFAGHEYADSIHLSLLQLDQYLIMFTSQSALQHSNARLLQSSKIILLSSIESIASISARFGMKQSEFSRFFKLFVGVSPEKFRYQSWM